MARRRWRRSRQVEYITALGDPACPRTRDVINPGITHRRPTEPTDNNESLMECTSANASLAVQNTHQKQYSRPIDSMKAKERPKVYPEILTGSPERPGRQTRLGGETSYFLPLCIDIAKTVRDTAKVTTNRKLHMRFRLASRSMTLDGLGWPWTEFCTTSHFSDATPAKRRNIDPHCQRWNCCALILFNDVYIDNVDTSGRSSARLSRAYLCVS